jgi:hypothetical protein
MAKQTHKKKRQKIKNELRKTDSKSGRVIDETPETTYS